MQRRGISNVVLMGGIALCIAMLLIGGMSLVVKLVESEARSQPEYLATQLVSTTELVNVAPENFVYQFYTPTGNDGWPVIGSLEIDGDREIICISKKTEDEIYGTITGEMGVAAGIAGAQYAYGKARAAAQKWMLKKQIAGVAKFKSGEWIILESVEKQGKLSNFFKFLKGSSKWGKIVRAGTFIAATAVASGLLTFWLTGDVNQAIQSSITTAITLVVYTVAPKLISALIVKYGAKWASRLSSEVPTNVALSSAKEGVCKIPLVGTASCAVLHALQIIINLAFAIWDGVERGVFFYQVWDASGKAVQKEKSNIVCKSFNSKKPLLTPPNLVPTVKFGDNFERQKGIAQTTWGVAAAELLVATGVAAAIPPVSPAGHVNWFYIIPSLLSLVPAVISLAPLIQNPSDVMPRSECSGYNQYSPRDCPNWFISMPIQDVLLASVAGGSFVDTLVKLPAGCALLSLLGPAGMLCTAATYSTAVAIFLNAPGHTFAALNRAYEVGFNKQVNSPIEKYGMEFANNTGFWYAELPFVIEFTKVYNGSENTDIIIRKV